MKAQTEIRRKPTQPKCRRNHRLTPDNIYVRKDGYPACRKCIALADKRYHQKRQLSHPQKATA